MKKVGIRQGYQHRFFLIRQGSIWTNRTRQFDQPHNVTLSEAKGLSRSAARSFAALRMTGNAASPCDVAALLSGSEILRCAQDDRVPGQTVWAFRGDGSEILRCAQDDRAGPF